MKKEIKIFSVLFLILTLIFISGKTKAATPNEFGNSATFSCYSSSKLVAGEEIELIVKLDSLTLKTGEGIAGIGAKLTLEDKYFDQSLVTDDNFEGLNKFTVAGYDTNNKNFSIIRYSILSELKDVFKIKLKVRNNVVINQNDYTTIKIHDIVTAGGTATGNIIADDIEIKMGPNGIIDPIPSGVTPTGVTPSGTIPSGTIPSGTTPTGTNPTGTNPTGTNPTGTNPSNGGGSGNVTSSGKLPQTGDAGNVIVIGSLVGMIALTGFGFIKYRRLDK